MIRRKPRRISYFHKIPHERKMEMVKYYLDNGCTNQELTEHFDISESNATRIIAMALCQQTYIKDV